MPAKIHRSFPRRQPTTKQARLTIDAGSAPPNEFRVFIKGVNKTSKGNFLFDDEAAKSVMAAYRQNGVDVMIDLEHLSLDSEGNNYDPSAYGWCKLELRNGELWAVSVAWTQAGAARLTNKESRYISPAFHFLSESGRITEIYNIAICAVPATYETPALIAASKRVGKQIGTLTIEVGKMDIKKILAALGLGEEATLDDVLQAIKALKDDEGSEGDAENADDPADDEDTDTDDDAATAAALKDLPPKLQAKLLAANASNKAMAARLNKLEREYTSGAIETMIAANVDKLPKGLEDWARKQSVETLAEYFKKATPVRKEAKRPPAEGGGEGGHVEEVKLTAEDLKVCKLHGTDPVKFLAAKKRSIEKRKQDAEAANA